MRFAIPLTLIGCFSMIVSRAEGQGFWPMHDDLKPVFRFNNPRTAVQLLTVRPREEDPNAMREFRSEGVAFYVQVQPSEGMAPLFRFLKPTGGYFFSTSRRAGEAIGARLEGPLGFISPQPRRGLVA